SLRSLAGAGSVLEMVSRDGDGATTVGVGVRGGVGARTGVGVRVGVRGRSAVLVGATRRHSTVSATSTRSSPLRFVGTGSDGPRISHPPGARARINAAYSRCVAASSK